MTHIIYIYLVIWAKIDMESQCNELTNRSFWHFLCTEEKNNLLGRDRNVSKQEQKER